jgi:hypothetical protein
MITRETASNIAKTYREIEYAEELLAQVEKELEKEDRPDWRGEPQAAGRRCELGWPMDGNSRRLFQVEPAIARAVIVAHVADQRSKLEKFNAMAMLEINAK